MQKIKLKFSANDTFVSKFIRVFTLSKYSHVDYVFDDGRCYSSWPGDGVDYTDLPFTISEYVEFEVNSKEKIEEFLLQQSGKMYDWLAIFAFLTPARNWHHRGKWFCSELIAAAIERDRNLFNERYSRVTPGDLYNAIKGIR